jgi:myosin-5
MERYRLQGEGMMMTMMISNNNNTNATTTSSSITSATPYKNGNHKSATGSSSSTHTTTSSNTTKLPPHVYKTADDAYRSMKRGLENSLLMQKSSYSSSTKTKQNIGAIISTSTFSPSDQSILVSGESGAGKTVTTKIVLNYFAMLSKQIGGGGGGSRGVHKAAAHSIPRSSLNQWSSSPLSHDDEEEEMCIEQQVLQSNTILEAFGNARTLRNDNSSRFGKYIDIRFTTSGKLSGAKIETYLLEKVRLIHPSAGERNYHIFYQFLEAATVEERIQLGLDGYGMHDFKLLNGTGTYDRRDGVVDGTMHLEMLDAMVSNIIHSSLESASVYSVCAFKADCHHSHLTHHLAMYVLHSLLLASHPKRLHLSYA